VIGIIAYGGYVPYNRLKFETIAAAYGKSAKDGEKAVAYCDEDSITMAVAASLAGLNKIDSKSLDAVFFATTTSPYAEKQGATNIAAAVDAKRNIRTCDFSGSLRANSSAMLAALDGAELGHTTLVAIGDCRLGGADGANEAAFGDGAAAFVFGSENVIAKKIAAYSMSVDFNDMWRSRTDNIVRNWDVRFAVTQGYEKFITESVKAVFAQTGLCAADFAKVILYAHEERHQITTATMLGFKPEQIQKAMYNSIGNTGCASAPLMLARALEKARPGDKLMFVSYGEGCDIIVFEATASVRDFTPYPSLTDFIEAKSSDLTYGKYLKWKSMIEFEPQKRPEQERSALPDYFRNYKKNNALYGSRCMECGTPQFPPQRVCAKCHCVDKMEEYRFYGRKAWVKTFTMDGLSISLDSPNYLVVVEFEGGGKMMTYLVDCQKEDIKVNMEVVLTHRKLYEANGVHTYFWKVAPKKNVR
jgi:3-hydroxy-3-methylglutaryl CoA synthase